MEKSNIHPGLRAGRNAEKTFLYYEFLSMLAGEIRNYFSELNNIESIRKDLKN